MSSLAGRILHLFANYKWTGPADPAIRSAVQMRALGCDVTFAQAGFVHRGGEHRVAEVLWQRGLPVVSGLELRKHFHVRSLLHDIAVLRSVLRRDRYELVHCHLPADHLLATVACRLLPEAPAIVRTLYEPEAPERGWRETFAFRRTHGVIAPTAAAWRGVQDRFGLAADRILLQEPVTERRELEGGNLRTRWGIGAGPRVVGITARIQPHRRFDLLWATARLVVDQVPGVRFVLLGRGNEEDTREHVTRPIERLGLAGHVLLPGYQTGPDYDAALRSLDVFLFLVPGSDGTCRAVCDAMAFGVPVVATQRGILPELLAARRDGEVPGRACPEAPEALATEIVRLLRNEPLRRQCGEAALRRARLDMDPRRAALRTLELYARLLAERPGAG
ncbi:MAG TPA: glycosyltransferase family 4 protein [Planctomycetota bacterium]